MKANRTIRVAIAGPGNCASALVQSVFREKLKKDLKGVMHKNLGGYGIADIKFVAAFGVSKDQVGKELSEALFSSTNCTQKISDIPYMGVWVSPGPVLDGVADHMRSKFCPHDMIITEDDVVAVLKESKAEILLNYMPVGSEEATAFYANCALKAGCGFINCMPSFICSKPEWAEKFRKAGLPCIGDDVKSQIGASVLNRSILNLFDIRGTEFEGPQKQHNRGNNSDFENMSGSSEEDRLSSKYKSKTNTVVSNVSQDVDFDLICNGLDRTLKGDEKVCEIRIKAIGCGAEITFNGELKVIDSYNSAGIILEAIRIMKLALNRGITGPIIPACAFFMKTPPEQMEDNLAKELLEDWIHDDSRTIICSHSRIQDFSYSGQKYSEFWTRTTRELISSALRNHLKVEIMSLKDHYHDEKEYLEVVREAVRKLLNYPPGYEKNLVLPFSITDKNLKKKMINLLQECEGINIFGINVAPNEEFLSHVPNIHGYVGMNETKVGEELYKELLSLADVSTIMIIRHQKNQGLEWRIEAIKRLAEADNKKVIVFGVHEQRQIKKYVDAKGTGIITLGCRGTEVILGLRSSRDTPIVCMDNNSKVDAFLDQMEIASCFSQEEIYKGIIFSGIINAEMSPTVARA